ncbi:KDO transferase A [Actinidia rufa]|uniref:KDO transferase A n=1 Tax=Actinidia rufa TaxID=165716 RepID=A0A7J0GJ54_9ERIC|nr:KDO transferase A [Actinidia rufa]
MVARTERRIKIASQRAMVVEGRTTMVVGGEAVVCRAGAGVSSLQNFDTGELRDFYRLTPIAVIGGSFFPHLTGHNICEAAAAGCAVLTGGLGTHDITFRENDGHVNWSETTGGGGVLSGTDLQVSGKLGLEKALIELFSNLSVLEARRAAARQAFDDLSTGVIENVWNLLDFHVFRISLS